jgi:hypothetical protein
MLKSNVDTSIELDTIMCANWLIDEKQVPVLSHCPCWPIPESPLSDFLFTNFSHPEYDWNIACYKQLCHDTPPPPPPLLFVIIKSQLLSVRTVINMLHFLNQLIVYIPYENWRFPNCLKNNLAKNDIFVISGYGPFIFICPSIYGLNMAYRCSSLFIYVFFWVLV